MSTSSRGADTHPHSAPSPTLLPCLPAPHLCPRFFPLRVFPVSPLPDFSSILLGPSPSSCFSCRFPGVCIPQPAHLPPLPSCPHPIPGQCHPPPLSVLAVPSACLQGRGPLTLRGSGLSLWGPVHGATPRVPSLLPWLPRRAGSRAQGRAEGGGREHLARQPAGERSGWQNVLAPAGDRGEPAGAAFEALRRNGTGNGSGFGFWGSLARPLVYTRCTDLPRHWVVVKDTNHLPWHLHRDRWW